MFIRVLLAAAVAALSCGVLAEEPTPRYVHSRYLVEQATRMVRHLTVLQSTDDAQLPSPKRDYAILLGLLDTLSEFFALGCPIQTYDEIYLEFVNETVPYAWEHPDLVIERVDALLKETFDSIRNIYSLMDEYCPDQRTGKVYTTATKDIDCDTVVNLQVLLHPSLYQKDAEVFLAMASLADLYLRQPYKEIAQRHGIIPFLITGKDKLRELVTRVTLVKRMLYETVGACDSE